MATSPHAEQMNKFKALVKTIWHPKREVAINGLPELEHALANNDELSDVKKELILSVARELKANSRPTAQPTDQPKGKVRVLRTAAQAQARAAALRKAKANLDSEAIAKR